MILFIDTSKKNLIEVKLKDDQNVIAFKTKRNQYGSQILLPLIISLLKNNKISFNDLDQVEVITGPGSFTGIRVGIAIANAIGFALNIPVNGKKIETDIRYS